MSDGQLPIPDKAAAQHAIEQMLKRLGVHKGELAAVLAVPPSTLSRKLGTRYPHDLFTESEVNQLAAYLEMTSAQREQLRSSYGYARTLAETTTGRGRTAGPRDHTMAASATPPATARQTNLPRALTSLIGRTWERREVAGLLAGSRLLTLTGPGGCGKTRLALKVAEDVQGRFADGVWFVELASTVEAAFAPRAVAAALGVREEPNRSPMDVIAEWLAARDLLLVLDNCEHLIDACAAMVEALLAACPSLRVLATSRERLGAAGETVWQVPPLEAPPAPGSDAAAASGAMRQQEAIPGARPGEWSLEAYPAVQLFVERARAVRPSFVLTDAHADAVAAICRRLEGMPLALELAAARTSVLTVEQLAGRLDDALRLLTSGNRTAPSRHQTLAETIA